MARRTDNRRTDAAKLALWALILTPITILIHELGHFSIPLLFDLPAQLHPTTVSGGAVAGRAPAWLVAMQAGGGPFVSIAMSLLAAAVYRRKGRPLWALAAAAAAVSRFMVTTAYLGLRLLLFGLGRPYQAQPNFDEHHVATALGLPVPLLALAATLFLLGLSVWLLRRIERGRRVLYFIVVVAGIVAGSVAWYMLAPPVLASTG